MSITPQDDKPIAALIAKIYFMGQALSGLSASEQVFVDGALDSNMVRRAEEIANEAVRRIEPDIDGVLSLLAQQAAEVAAEMMKPRK